MANFLIAAIAMLISLVPCLLVIISGDAMTAVVGYEALGSGVIVMFALLAEGFQRTSEFEFPVVLAVLLLGSALVFVRLLERGL